jgi:hypothetical protein
MGFSLPLSWTIEFWRSQSRPMRFLGSWRQQPFGLQRKMDEAPVYEAISELLRLIPRLGPINAKDGECQTLARGFELPAGREERSNEGWRFTDERGDEMIEG